MASISTQLAYVSSEWQASTTHTRHPPSPHTAPPLHTHACPTPPIILQSSTPLPPQRADALRDDIDLYLRPPVEAFGTLEFGSLAEIQRLGYDYAKAEVKRWKAALRARGDPRCAVFDLAANQARGPKGM